MIATYFSKALPYDSIWLDGTFLPWREVRIPVTTHALHYASCIFEGIRVYDSRPFKLEEHIDRLFNSANLIGLELAQSRLSVQIAIEQLIALLGMREGYLRPLAWNGCEKVSLLPSDNRAHLAIIPLDWPGQRRREVVISKVHLCYSSWQKPSPRAMPLQAKSAAHYMVSTMARREAISNGFDDAILLDADGCLCEATAANIFMIQRNRLITPPTEHCLNGITRQTVLELAVEMGLEPLEQHIRPQNLYEADEFFLTGTACEILPIKSIEHRVFKTSAITNVIAANYLEYSHLSQTCSR